MRQKLKIRLNYYNAFIRFAALIFMTQESHTYRYEKPFQLERGATLPRLDIAYHTFGELNEEKSNVVWVFHALTANANALDWWSGLLTEQSAINTNEHFIVCANILGSPYGTTSPLSIDPSTEKPYYSTFPPITIRDMVKAHQLLRNHLGIDKIAIGLGGSMGGFQTYEWAIQEPDTFEKVILVASAPKETPWRVAVHSAQRMAIEADPTWRDDSHTAGAKGLAASRAIGMLSYRNHVTFEQTQLDSEEKFDDFAADSYMRYQGEKLSKRKFNGFLLWNLTKALDSHDIGRGRGGLDFVLSILEIPVLQIGITSDLLFPIEEQNRIAKKIPHVTYHAIDSMYGHDGFLTESKKINKLIQEFL